MLKFWTDEAWEDYLNWQEQDDKNLERINTIIEDIEQNPYEGIGKPEPLRGDRQGYWSRHIDSANRIVYKVQDDQIIIVQCSGLC